MVFRDIVERIYEAFRSTTGAFRRVENTRDGQKVLAAIRTFCAPDDPVVVPNDPMGTGVRIGRREVWDMIARNLSGGLSDQELREFAKREAKREAERIRTENEGAYQ